MLIHCADCGKGIGKNSPRVVVAGVTVCGDCAYYRDTGKPNPRIVPDDEKRA